MSVLVVYLLTVVSHIPIMLILYLVESRDGGGRRCAQTFFVDEACGIAGVAIDTVFWIAPYLFVLATGIVLAQRLTDPSKIGPGLVATVGLCLPWIYALGHIFGAFPTS